MWPPMRLGYRFADVPGIGHARIKHSDEYPFLSDYDFHEVVSKAVGYSLLGGYIFFDPRPKCPDVPLEFVQYGANGRLSVLDMMLERCRGAAGLGGRLFMR